MHNRQREPVSKATTAVAGLDAPVEVRRHPAARRMTLRVSRTKRTVIVTVPMRCNVDDAGTFVNRHLEWVRDRLGTLPEPVPFANGASIPVRGIFHRLLIDGTRSAARPLIEARQPMAQNGEPVLAIDGLPSSAPRFLLRWLHDEARRDLETRVSVHAERLSLHPIRIAIRDQTSRWGSCSTTRVLSFSWRLILAPPEVLDYVAAHEVAHLAEMNHGPKFWALVKQTMPDMDHPRRWLAAYGTELHRYGPMRG
ncbi:MAG: M48 family metallopeptidase [Hyphomicrobiaceae bacterium]|nr:M48 family metallopeptidase [Hyphomicrobiaceae bacterium]